jgi:hypothetical protein
MSNDVFRKHLRAGSEQSIPRLILIGNVYKIAIIIVLILTYILIRAALKFKKAAERDMAIENKRRVFRKEKGE